MTVIALDAMGGDFAPRIPVDAAVRSIQEKNCKVILVGDQDQLKRELDRHQYDPDRLRIQHASQQIVMEDSPIEAIRNKPDSSVKVAFELVKRGEAQAVIGAGHSGAMMIAGKFILDVLPGVDRPAIITHLPHKRGESIFLDSGANVDCKPHYLEQFALMGSIYAKLVLGEKNPRIMLLSNGKESGKGNELTRQAYKLLEKGPLNFEGYLEPRELFKGKAEVIVCDGFVGNLVLKTAEAASLEIRLLIKESTFRSPLARLSYWMSRGIFLDLARRTDYREIGGSLLLGLKGVAMVCHGASNARTIHNAINLASHCSEKRLLEEINGQFNSLAVKSGKLPASD